MVDKTPAQVARETLDLINAHRENFQMSTWVSNSLRHSDAYLNSVVGMSPSTEGVWASIDEGVSCGTTLCAAGWAAVATGYKVATIDIRVDRTDPYSDRIPSGWCVPANVDTKGDLSAYAYRGNGISGHVETIASEALGITENSLGVLFHTSPETAIEILQALADAPDTYDDYARDEIILGWL